MLNYQKALPGIYWAGRSIFRDKKLHGMLQVKIWKSHFFSSSLRHFSVMHVQSRPGLCVLLGSCCAGGRTATPYADGTGDELFQGAHPDTSNMETSLETARWLPGSCKWAESQMVVQAREEELWQLQARAAHAGEAGDVQRGWRCCNFSLQVALKCNCTNAFFFFFLQLYSSLKQISNRRSSVWVFLVIVLYWLK